MLVAANTILGSQVSGVDGHVGAVADLYFNGDIWSLRYLVVDTGEWLPGRKILLAPAAVDHTDWPRRDVNVRETKQQIKHSPPIGADKPFSRQAEDTLAEHFSWPKYWAPAGGVMPAMGAPPPGDRFAEFGSGEEAIESSVATETGNDANDPDLRSAKEVKHYRIEAADGEIGHVEDFIVDDTAWIIRYLVINTRNWLPGKSVLVAPRWTETISWREKRLVVGLTREAIKESPRFNPSTPVNRQYEERLYDYYGREAYWK